MNNEMNLQKDANHWSNALLYQWNFDELAKRYVKAREMMINTLKNIERYRFLPLEELKKQAASVLGDESVTYNVALAETDADLARENLLRNYDFINFKDFCMIIVIFSRYKYPMASKVFLHILQYGPLNNWNETVAYNSALDKKIEEFILRQEWSDSQLEQLNVLMQQNPTCGTLKAVKAFALWQKTSGSIENVQRIFHLLAEAIQDGIPEKYKYAISMIGWFFPNNSKGLLEIKREETDRPFNNTIAAGTRMFEYFLFPSAEIKDDLLSLDYLPAEWTQKLLMDAPMTMQDIAKDIDAAAEICKKERQAKNIQAGFDIAQQVMNKQGCCVWLVVSLAGWTALGGVLYWVWTLL